MIIILSLQFTVALNLYLLLQFILKKEKKHRKWFVLLLLANIYLILTAMGLYIFLPSLFEDINSTVIIWVFCGLIMLITVSTQVQILKAITRRLKEHQKQVKIIKDMTAAQNAEMLKQSEKLLAERKMMYSQIPYRHVRVREEKKKAAEQKKLEKSLIELTTIKEMLLFISTMPFMLLCSAYFIAKIINYLVSDVF